MPVTSMTTDPQALTITVVADFAAPLRRVWDAYADPRQLELFWGPPTYPATFFRHDVAVGGHTHYAMTGPEGDQHHGYWTWIAVTDLASFEVLDGFAHADGSPDESLPAMRMTFVFSETATGTRLVTTSTFASLEALEQVVAMGVEEGTRLAMGQIDGVLADLRSFAADLPAAVQLLSETQVRVSRVIHGTPEQVWRAHYDADLLRRWLLGPDGWTMPVAEVSDIVGEPYRYEWQREGGAERFGFEGELIEATPPHRAVTTERLIGHEGPGTLNELTLTPVDGGTLLSLVITYPSSELRDTVLGTGMVDGMETSYARLESEVLGAP